jgi:hypothetical protein
MPLGENVVKLTLRSSTTPTEYVQGAREKNVRQVLFTLSGTAHVMVTCPEHGEYPMAWKCYGLAAFQRFVRDSSFFQTATPEVEYRLARAVVQYFAVAPKLCPGPWPDQASAMGEIMPDADGGSSSPSRPLAEELADLAADGYNMHAVAAVGATLEADDASEDDAEDDSDAASGVSSTSLVQVDMSNPQSVAKRVADMAV